ncbi:MAG: undecaprenyl/decaprenyl-phosphate alpha-N-acetylglucosaminyl 1-phosphate transferase [Firmicutes bacterium]|nr:undecaprenyl/decaprenyl-phosphate alpha-N-acetylglucosaminyl 1-phosphate transferase [Bacillota bacterium]
MPFSMRFWLVFGVAFLISLVITPLTEWLAPKLGVMDIPKDDRRMHTKPIPRFGGLAIFAGVAVATVIILIFMNGEQDVFEKIKTGMLLKTLLVGVFVYILGLLDDIFHLRPMIKLMGQAIAAILLYVVGVRVQIIMLFGAAPTSTTAHVVSFIVTMIWVIAIMNTVNLIDGVDGLAAGITIIAAFCISYIAYIHGYYLACLLMLAVAGACIGFLPFNFYPAKTFMGDGGSLFLGFCLASFSLMQPVKSVTLGALVIPLLVLGIPVIDTLFAIFRRLVNKKPVMQADKGHIHHRLMRAGLGQRRTVLILYGITAVMGIGAVVYSRQLYVEAAGLMILGLAFVYVVLTDPNHWVPKVREDKETTEKKDQITGPAEGDENGKNDNN